MLYALSTLIWDPQGYVEVDALPAQTDGEVRRRVNRVATLDGGAVVNDAGYSEADRTIELRWVRTSPAHEYLIERLVRLYPRIHVATRAAVYEAAVEAYLPGAAESALRLLVISKLSA